VLELEQFLMEGAYNKIAQRQGALPDPSYEYFMSMLMDTVRDEIASCAESAYAKLSGDEAKKLLGFKSVKELITYSEERGWAVDSKGAVVFNEDVNPATSKDIPSMRLINQTLLYAKELERIV
jgi:26S proteasome regulatory subunit N12